MSAKPCYRIIFWFLGWSQVFSVTAQPAFNLNGSSVELSENCYRITSDQTSPDVGSIWSELPLDLEHSFDLQFAINLGCSQYAGEGLAFVMHTHKDGYDALGCNGAAMGFAAIGGSTPCSAILPSLAIEIDSKYNSGMRDIGKPHLALIKDGNVVHPLIAPVVANPTNNVLDCEYHTLQITWKPSTQKLEVYFDGNLRMSYDGDLMNSVFGGAQEVYFGFTGSTSRTPNMQMVCVQSVTIEVDAAFAEKRAFEESVGIYPNPLKEKLTIDLDFEEEEYVQMQLYDSAGNLIYEIPTHSVRENQYYFNLPGLPSGVYFITITNGTHRVSQKIIHMATIRA